MERFRGMGFIEPNRGPRTIHDLIRDDKKQEPMKKETPRQKQTIVRRPQK